MKLTESQMILKNLKEQNKLSFTLDEFKDAFYKKYGDGAYFYYIGEPDEYNNLGPEDIYSTFNMDLEYGNIDNNLESAMESIDLDVTGPGSYAARRRFYNGRRIQK